jgi:hypothetical protein
VYGHPELMIVPLMSTRISSAANTGSRNNEISTMNQQKFR